jgi:aryl-alcohol dehydrogenase-like predicted oxidoreductase
VEEGLLVQQPGRGTFPTQPVMARSSSGHLLSFAEAMGEQGIAHETRVVASAVRQADAICAERLGLEVGEDYLRRAHTITPVENPYNLCDRTQESLFDAFDELRVGLVVHCPLAQGPAHGCLCEGRNLWGRRLPCLHGERRLDRAHGRAGGLPARAARAYAGTRGRALVLTGHFDGRRHPVRYDGWRE